MIARMATAPSTFRFSTDDGAVEVRVLDGTLSIRYGAGAWERITKSALRDRYRRVRELWDFFEGHGISRPQSGPSGVSTSRTYDRRRGAGERDIKVWFTPDEYALIEQAAVDRGLHLTEVVRHAVVHTYGGKKK